MPRLNRHGQATTGYGVTWYDDTRTIHQDCSSGVCVIRLSDGTPIADHGCNYVYARHGVWASFLAGRGVDTSYAAPRPDGKAQLPEASLEKPDSDPVGPDGAIAFKERYHSHGPWNVLEPNGEVWVLTAGDAKAVQMLGGRRAVWIEDDWLKTTPGLPLTVPTHKVWWPRVAEADGRLVLLYQAHTGHLVLDGKVIGAPGSYFRPDLMRTDGGWLVVWSSNEGESDVLSRPLTDAELRALPDVGQPVPEPDRKPTPDDDPEPEPVPTISAELQAQVLDRIAALKDAYTEAWRLAHRHIDIHGNPTGVSEVEATRFAYLVAYDLYTHVSPRFGLNGKRGDVRHLSMDAFAYKFSDDVRDVAIIDYIQDAGIDSARIAWADQTEVSRPHGGGIWVQPERPPEYRGEDQEPGDKDDPADPHVCPVPRWPDDHECPVCEREHVEPWPGHAELVNIVESWHAAFGRRLNEGQLVHLLYIYFAEKADAGRIAETLEGWR